MRRRRGPPGQSLVLQAAVFAPLPLPLLGGGSRDEQKGGVDPEGRGESLEDGKVDALPLPGFEFAEHGPADLGTPRQFGLAPALGLAKLFHPESDRSHGAQCTLRWQTDTRAPAREP